MPDKKTVALHGVRRRAKRIETEQAKLHTSIVVASQEGASLREIAAVAGLSHTQVNNVLKATDEATLADLTRDQLNQSIE